MPKYPNNLRSIRMREHRTQEWAASILGLTVQAYQPYEYGARELKPSMLRKLAPALNSTAMEILGLEDEPWVIKAKPTSKTVPVVGRIAAGCAREAIEDTSERWYVPDTTFEDHPKAFYLVVGGDSMDRIIPEGAYVLIDPEAEVHSGDVAAVLVNGFDATLKRIYFAGDTIVLHPESHNPEHHDVTIDRTNPDAPFFRVVGKAITYTAPDGWRA